MNYWVIELYTPKGELIKVKPANVLLVQKKIDSQTGSIITPARSILIKNIADFRETDELYQDQQLLEDSKRAFGEPTYTTNGIKSRVVKVHMSRRIWEREKSQIPGYHLLESLDNHVVVAITVPIHLIDDERMFDLTPDEEMRLAKRM